MPVEYLIRFDDLCPTMNWDLWGEIEKVLVDQEIAPILAVVPDNRDKALMVREPHHAFWDRVRSWQARGWTIGVHGYQHVYVTDRAGLVGLNNRSEFAGLDELEQERKLKNALAILERERITPEVWVAPGHSFDSVTLRVLKRLKLDVVSDGLFLSPNVDVLGLIHIPQQLWRFRRMPLGLWTVCYHHNDWTRNDAERFRSDVVRYRRFITSVRRVLSLYRIRDRSVSDTALSRVCLAALKARSALRGLLACGRRLGSRAETRWDR